MERYKFCDKHVSKRVNATKQINKRSKAKTEEQGQGSPNSERLINSTKRLESGHRTVRAGRKKCLVNPEKTKQLNLGNGNYLPKDFFEDGGKS